MRRGLAAFAATVAGLLALTDSANAAFTTSATRSFPLPGAASLNSYGLGFEGSAGHGESFWTVSGVSNTGYVEHYDDEGNNLGDGFSFPYNNIYPLDVGYFGGRVFMTLGSSSGTKMIGVAIGGGHDILSADSETNSRMGGNQKSLRIYSGGAATLGFGQDNKIATMDLTGGAVSHPWYRQTFYGTGINKNYDPNGAGFETCSVGPGALGGTYGEAPKCGTYSSYWIPGKYEGFNYPNDVAIGQGGVYVSELDGHRITFIDTVTSPGGILSFRFGAGPGSAAGQLARPQSVVVQPGTGNVFVSEEGNRRISVFNGGGGYIASFGYGVLNGANEMQVCGVDIGQCQAGIAYATNPRSYFTQLDFGPEGELYAWMPLVDEVQVFSVAGASGPATPPAAPGAPSGPGGAPNVKQKVRLAASPLKVVKGKKTKLTATVNGGKNCADRLVLFQRQDSRSWDNLGKAVKAGKKCKPTKLVKVTAKSVFRAVLINSRNQATLGYSPKVTVKLK